MGEGDTADSSIKSESVEPAVSGHSRRRVRHRDRGVRLIFSCATFDFDRRGGAGERRDARKRKKRKVRDPEGHLIFREFAGPLTSSFVA